jgi:hypothetical protein
MTMKTKLIVAIVLATAAAGLPAADQALVVSFARVQELVQAKCSACHDWAGTAEGIVGEVTPGDPAASPMWKKVSMDLMPPDGPLVDAEKTLLKDWIAAGAPTDAAAADATTGATTPAADAGGKPSTFLGFKSKTAFHMATGYTSSALFLGAGIVGAVQWGTLIAASHDYRDANGIGEDTMSTLCRDYIISLRQPGTFNNTLRWVHVGLMSAAETLYLADAVTGISMLTKDRPGLTPQDIHRYAFFTHGALMITEIILGIASTAFLDLGDHWSIIGYGIAHTAIGVAIPVVMLSAGIYINSVFR